MEYLHSHTHHSKTMYSNSCTHRKRNRPTKKGVLYLNIQSCYFDKISTRQKFYERRDRTQYYKSRIEEKAESITHIWFMNGMKTNSRQMLVEVLGLRITSTKYILQLGKIISQDISEIDNLVH